ncbi:MAG TPA: cytochrome c oxidase assembly protein [Rudaea sp.]
MKSAHAALGLLAMGSAIEAHAHTGEGSHLAWTFDAGVVLPLAIALLLFVIGLARLRRPATRTSLFFFSGWLVLACALVSPLHAAGEHSFAAHMFEHELLMLIAAPLLVAAHANGVLLWALPHRVRRPVSRFFLSQPVSGAWRALTSPALATLLQAIALWAWHAPVLFDRALSSPGWHIAQHLSFLVTALLFWSAMFDPHRRRREPALVIGCLFATAVVSGALGALMAFSTSPWYAAYRSMQLDAFGLTPAQDQQIAGLLMWIPGGLIHMAIALALLAKLLQSARPPGQTALPDRERRGIAQ